NIPFAVCARDVCLERALPGSQLARASLSSEQGSFFYCDGSTRCRNRDGIPCTTSGGRPASSDGIRPVVSRARISRTSSLVVFLANESDEPCLVASAAQWSSRSCPRP